MMKLHFIPMAGIIFATAAALSWPIYAGDQPATQPASTQLSEAADPDAPPLTGQIDRETSAGTRDLGVKNAVDVLAPLRAQDAITSTFSPKLVFYLAEPTDLPIRVTLQERLLAGGLGDIVMKWLSNADGAREVVSGLHLLDLSSCGVQLRPGVLYRWSVSIVTDLNDQSKQDVSWGLIKYVPSTTPQSSFYDELAVVYASLLKNPDDNVAKMGLKKLLDEQMVNYVQNAAVNAPEPATLEKQHADGK